MVSVVHIYNRWSKSELNCYVDGAQVSHTEMSWLVNTNEVYITICHMLLQPWCTRSWSHYLAMYYGRPSDINTNESVVFSPGRLSISVFWEARRRWKWTLCFVDRCPLCMCSRKLLQPSRCRPSTTLVLATRSVRYFCLLNLQYLHYPLM